MYTCKGHHFSHVWLFATPWTVALQAPLPEEFSRQYYCSIPGPGIKPLSLMSPARAGSLFTTCTTWKTQTWYLCLNVHSNQSPWGQGLFLIICVYSGASQMALVVKKLPDNTWDVRDTGLIPGLGRSPEGGQGDTHQDSCLENPMAEEPGGLQSMGLQRVGHDWSNLACTHAHVYSRPRLYL